MITRQELANAMLRSYKLKMGVVEKYDGSEYQCAYCDNNGQVVFDQTTQQIKRYENGSAVAYVNVGAIEPAIVAMEEYSTTGHLTAEIYL
jgi:hypothetical protein